MQRVRGSGPHGPHTPEAGVETAALGGAWWCLGPQRPPSAGVWAVAQRSTAHLNYSPSFVFLHQAFSVQVLNFCKKGFSKFLLTAKNFFSTSKPTTISEKDVGKKEGKASAARADTVGPSWFVSGKRTPDPPSADGGQAPPLLTEPGGAHGHSALGDFPQNHIFPGVFPPGIEITLMPTFRNVLLSRIQDPALSQPSPGWPTTGSFYGPQRASARPGTRGVGEELARRRGGAHTLGRVGTRRPRS